MKNEIKDKSYCSFDCNNIKCSRNQDNIKDKDSDRVQFSFFEECTEYIVKPGTDAVDLKKIRDRSNRKGVIR